MVCTKPITHLFALAAVALLAACTTPPFNEGKVFVGDRAIKLEELKSGDLFPFLAEDWAKFDKHVKDAPDFFSSKPRSIYWHLVITPPFPTYWPPRKPRSVTYYAYAQYQELYRHGPSLSRSAPWAKVVLTEGMPDNKLILAVAIGPAVHGEGSVLIGVQMANRKRQIIKDGEAYLSHFVTWTAIPDDDAEVKAIREYYCEWALADRTADLIKDNHRIFFEWLSCPPRSRYPVLQ